MNASRLSVMAAVLLLIGMGCTPSASPRTASTGGPSDAVVGAWTVTITEEDFRNAGLDDPGLIAENSGTYIFTVNADGTFTEAQQADHPVRWPVFRGTWSETGPDSLGLRTSFPPDFEGEYIEVRWSRDGETLRLAVVSPQEPALKVHFETHPWSPAP
jgi:hypothetical protein